MDEKIDRVEMQTQKKENQLQNELNQLRDRNEQLLDEISRLRINIGNMTAQNQSLEEMLKQERQRREGENGEIRNLLYQEQEKSIQAAREAEKFATEIRMYKEKADRAIFDLERKNEQVEELREKLIDN